VPLPVPLIVIVRPSMEVNVAVTDWLDLIVTLQDPVPEHAPDQPPKADPVAGVAVSVTGVPDVYV
jgi:hypothetical protein